MSATKVALVVQLLLAADAAGTAVAAVGVVATVRDKAGATAIAVGATAAVGAPTAVGALATAGGATAVCVTATLPLMTADDAVSVRVSGAPAGDVGTGPEGAAPGVAVGVLVHAASTHATRVVRKRVDRDAFMACDLAGKKPSQFIEFSSK